MLKESDKLRLLYQEMPVVSLVLDEDLIIRDANDFGCGQLGFKREEILGAPFLQLCFHEERKFLEQNLRQCIRERIGNRRWECMRLRKDGSHFWVRDTVRVVDGKFLLISSEDITETRYLISELERQSSTDHLTGLYNRRKFDFFLEEHVLSVQSGRNTHVLFFIDLDHFKVVNDTCGHLCGDAFLRHVAQLMRSQIRSRDILGRLGGDEYGLLLDSCSIEEAMAVAQKLLGELEQDRFSWDEQSFAIGASIGGVLVEAGSGDASTLMAQADAACYLAKEKGRNRVQIYGGREMHGTPREGAQNWFGRIYEALDRGSFVLYGQRIENTRNRADGNGVHTEVLLRMRGSDGELLSPDAFMPAAEHYNLATRIDRWVIGELLACRESSTCSACGTFFVNLSGLTLGDSAYIHEVSNLLKDKIGRGLDICFEITESAAICNLDAARHFIDVFRALGCRFALDDFGSGLSSFGYLKALPVDYIKIDGGFVKNIDRDPLDQAVVRAIHEVARAFGKETVAEWVESEAALNMVRGMGIDFVQGYHVGLPQPLFETGVGR